MRNEVHMLENVPNNAKKTVQKLHDCKMGMERSLLYSQCHMGLYGLEGYLDHASNFRWKWSVHGHFT